MLRTAVLRTAIAPPSRVRITRVLAGAAEVPPSPSASEPILATAARWALLPRAHASSLSSRSRRQGAAAPKVKDLGEMTIDIRDWKRELAKAGVKIPDTLEEQALEADENEGGLDSDDLEAIRMMTEGVDDGIEVNVPFEFSDLPREKNGKKLYFDSAGQPVYLGPWKDAARIQRYLEIRPKKLQAAREKRAADAAAKAAAAAAAPAIEAAGADASTEDPAALAKSPGKQRKPRMTPRQRQLQDRLIRANIDPAIFRAHKHDLHKTIEASREMVAERRRHMEELQERTGAPVEAQMSLIEVLQILTDERTFDVHVVETRRRTDHHTHDFLVFASCRSDRHARAAADRLCKAMREKGVLIEGRYPPHVDGRESDDWMVVDCDLASVHFFTEEARRSYDVDALWEEDKAAEAAQSVNPFALKREARRRHRQQARRAQQEPPRPPEEEQALPA